MELGIILSGGIEWGGRYNVLSSYNRLSSNRGYPEIFIKSTEKEFARLYKFLLKRTTNHNLKQLNENNIRPKFIVRAGGTLGNELRQQMSPDIPDVSFAPDTFPILFITIILLTIKLRLFVR